MTLVANSVKWLRHFLHKGDGNCVTQLRSFTKYMILYVETKTSAHLAINCSFSEARIRLATGTCTLDGGGGNRDVTMTLQYAESPEKKFFPGCEIYLPHIAWVSALLLTFSRSLYLYGCKSAFFWCCLFSWALSIV